MKKIPKTMLIILVIISTLVTITSCVPNRITETKIKSSTERATQVEQKEIETEKAVTEILEKSTEETKTTTDTNKKTNIISDLSNDIFGNRIVCFLNNRASHSRYFSDELDA